MSDQVTLEVRNALLTLESTMQQIAVSEKGLELALKELTFARDRFAVRRQPALYGELDG